MVDEKTTPAEQIPISRKIFMSIKQAVVPIQYFGFNRISTYVLYLSYERTKICQGRVTSDHQPSQAMTQMTATIFDQKLRLDYPVYHSAEASDDSSSTELSHNQSDTKNENK
jgi:hypothetical protein